jgi:hypothetical protein
MNMTHSRKIWIGVGAALLVLFVIMPVGAFLLSRLPCMPKSLDIDVTFENQMPTDVTIVNQDLNENGDQFYEETLGIVSAGQTENMTMVVPIAKSRLYTYDKRTLINTFQLKAEDSAGSVVWQKSWPWREFLRLNREEGFIRIVISPETDAE